MPPCVCNQVWKIVPQREAVLAMLGSKIQEEGLRTYLFTFAPHYDSISLDQLVKVRTTPSFEILVNLLSACQPFDLVAPVLISEAS